MVTFVYSGQGSQKKGMGEKLFDEYSELTKKADQVLGYSIKELCLEDPHKQLRQTQYSQPALYVANVLMHLNKVKTTGKKPDFLAGHSLGEYCALFASGAFDFETGLRLVEKRGKIMSCASGGAMAAVIGLDEKKIRKVMRENSLSNISIANYNTPSQLVIAGPEDDMRSAKSLFEDAGAELYIPLNVSGAFHTQYMEQAQEEFHSFINSIEFCDLKIPVISNVYAQPYQNHNIKETLVKQISSPVKWTDSIRYLMGKGEMQFEEIGPGNVLTNLIKKIKNEANPLIITYEEDLEKSTEIKNKEIHSEKENSARQTITNNIISAESLGSNEFKEEFNLKYAYVSGAMYRGIASKEMVVRMGRAGMLGYFGTGSLSLSQIEDDIQFIKHKLDNGQAYGMNLLSNPINPKIEDRIVDLFLEYAVKNIEASAYIKMSPALVRYRLTGIKISSEGKIVAMNKVLAKVSRPEVAQHFLSPAPYRIVNKLLEENKISNEQAELSTKVPMADALCVEADSGGHTDGGVAYALMPAMIRLKNEMMVRYQYKKKVKIGAAGGIGSPEAAAAAFILGADFILTGSINQCTVEAGTSDSVKDLLQEINVQDTEYAPAGDMFELGAKVQVLKKGLFFPSRANKLYELYQRYNSLDEIDERTKKQLQEKYFKRSFESIYEDVKVFFKDNPREIEKAEKSPKHKMALVFRWYFGYTTNLALKGIEDQKVNYQVHCGPALGAFNQWIKGTRLEDWRNRHVDEIGVKLMEDTAAFLNKRFQALESNLIK